MKLSEYGHVCVFLAGDPTRLYQINNGNPYNIMQKVSDAFIVNVYKNNKIIKTMFKTSGTYQKYIRAKLAYYMRVSRCPCRAEVIIDYFNYDHITILTKKTCKNEKPRYFYHGCMVSREEYTLIRNEAMLSQ